MAQPRLCTSNANRGGRRRPYTTAPGLWSVPHSVCLLLSTSRESSHECGERLGQSLLWLIIDQRK